MYLLLILKAMLLLCILYFNYPSISEIRYNMVNFLFLDIFYNDTQRKFIDGTLSWAFPCLQEK